MAGYIQLVNWFSRKINIFGYILNLELTDKIYSIWTNQIVKRSTSENIKGKTAEKLSRLDTDIELRQKILPLCRLKNGKIWNDPKGKHKVGVLDATSLTDVKKLFGKKKAQLVINDPPYNVVVGKGHNFSSYGGMVWPL